MQAYALEVNAHRSNRETVAILSSLLTTALRSEPTYRLPVPTLLVHGDRDRIGGIATGTRAWAGREPLAAYAVIPDAGHASNLDNPEVLTAVRERSWTGPPHPSTSSTARCRPVPARRRLTRGCVSAFDHRRGPGSSTLDPPPLDAVGP